MNKLNQSNAEKTGASVGATSSATFHAERPQDEVEGVAPRKPAEPKGSTEGRDISCTETLNGPGKNSAGDDSHATGDGNQRPVSEGEKAGPPCQADTPGRDPDDTEGPAVALDGHSPAGHSAGTAGGNQPGER